MKPFLSLLLSLAALPALAAPSQIQAEYRISQANVVVGRMVESYARTGDTYVIESRTSTEGIAKLFLDDSVVLTSEGRFVSGALQPQVFQQRRTKDGTRDVRATFDWKGGVMRYVFKGESQEVALPAGTQDRLSVMYQFMNAPRSETFEVHMSSNGRKIERYTYRRVEDVKLSTPAGEFETLHYERVITEPGQHKAHVWLAKERFNFPVRVIFEDARGGSVDQTLVSFKAN